MALTLGVPSAARSSLTVNFDSLHTFANAHVLPKLYDNFFRSLKLLSIMRERGGFEPWSRSVVDRVPVLIGENPNTHAYSCDTQFTPQNIETSTSALYEISFYRTPVQFCELDLEKTEGADSVISKFKADITASIASLAKALHRDMILGEIASGEFAPKTYTNTPSNTKGVTPLSLWLRWTQDTVPSAGVGSLGHIDPSVVTNWRTNIGVVSGTAPATAGVLFRRDVTTYKGLIQAINDLILEITFHGVDESQLVMVTDPGTYSMIMANEADKIRYMTQSDQEAHLVPFSTALFQGRIPIYADYEIPDPYNVASGPDSRDAPEGGAIFILSPGYSFTYAERVTRSQFLDSGNFSDEAIQKMRETFGASALEKHPYMPFSLRPFQSPYNQRQLFASELTYGISLIMKKPRANGAIIGIKRNLT